MTEQKNSYTKITVACCAGILLIAFVIATIFSSNHSLNAVEPTGTTTTVETTTQTYNPITKLTLDHSTISITVGKKSALKATVKYGKQTSLENESYIWSSKNSSIATVTKKGKVKAVKPGKTYIICSSKSGTIKARCKVYVREPYKAVKSIKLDKDQISLNKNDKRALTPIITYSKSKNKTLEPIIWSSSNNKIATVSKKGVITGKANGTTTITAKSKYSNKSVICKVIVQKTKYLAVTFDDGPGDYTDTLLDALDKYHSKATFFVLGNRVNSYSKQLKREYELGMEIGSHTYAHKNLKQLSKKEVISEISNTNKAVKDITGAEPTVLRPPYGNYNNTVSKNAGVPMIYWSIDTLDWKYKKVSYVKKTVIKSAKDGEIMLLHDIHKTSVDGFIKALPQLKKDGYELVTVSELYAIKGKTMKKGVMYFGPKYDK